MSPSHIIVGLSGGVDSAVAALLLKKQGHHLTGVFMKNWEEEDEGKDCPSSLDIADAKAVCDRLDIPFHTVNFSEDYWNRVFKHFLSECKKGRTPNPDILCNTEIKFGAFLDYAQKIGCEMIATGHYVRRTGLLRPLSRPRNDGLAIQLLVGSDLKQDQSYFLYALNQTQLAHSIFPIGELSKSKVRALAKAAGFQNYNRKGSTGICFIGERRFKPFLSRYLVGTSGPIETPDGKMLGEHEGLMFYTVGQRTGLKIGGQKGGVEAPWYVAEKDLSRNALVVVQGSQHPFLFKSGLTVNAIHWISGEEPHFPFRCSAKIRYRQSATECTVLKKNESLFRIEFETPQRAVTPGQSVVFYQKEVCLGGGIIE